MRADGLARGVRIERRVVLSMMRAPVDLGADTGPFGSSDDLRRPPMFTVDFLASPPFTMVFDDHLIHASTHTESLWLTRWATMWIVVALALAYHTLFGGR